MRFAVPVLGWATGLICGALMGCQDLPDVERLRCGNGIVEQQVDEDCDGQPAGSPYACGAIGGADACRFICVDTDCPPGWACGEDQQCRASTGNFRRGEIVQLAGESLDLGDLDGDGVLDLVSHAQGKIRIAYGSGGGRFEDLHTVNAPTLQAGLVVADTDEDGLDDISFFTRNSLTILRGESSRILVPAHVTESDSDPSTTTHVVSIATRADDSHELLTLQGMLATEMTLAGRGLQDDAVIASLASTGPVLEPIRARMDDDLIDEIILGRARARTVVIFNIECPDDAEADCVTVVRDRIELPGGATLGNNPPLVGDLDGDGRDDLLVVMDQPDGVRVVAVGLGVEGGFGPLTVQPGLSQAAGCAPDCAAIVARFSAAQRLADVVGDGRADILTGTAIYEVTGEETLSLVVRHAFGEPLNILESVDVDGDGQLDVVGFGSGQVIFLLSDGARFTLVSSAIGDGFPPAFGDYDGDGRTDLATWQSTGELIMAFNGPTGLPTEQVVLGRFSAPVRLTTTQRRRPLSIGLDRPDDLAVVAPDGVALLFGDSGRLPSTFIGLSGARPISTPPVTQLAIGRFDEGPPGLIAYLANGLSFSAHAADLDALSGDPFSDLQVDGCTNFEPLGFVSSVVDWGADGVDELLQIETDRPRFEQPNTWHVQLAGLDAGAWRCRWNARVVTNNRPASLLSTDIDDDGAVDVITLLSPVDALAQLREGTADAQLAVWFDAPGSDDGGAPARFVVQPNATAAALVDLGADRTVMTFGDGRAWSLSWDGADFVPFDRFAIPRDVLTARTADVDGDGIDDVLLKTNTGVSVYRQASCSARQAWLGVCARPSTTPAP